MRKITRFEKTGEGRTLWVEVPDEYAPFIASKGPVALDGISLTPAEVSGNLFSVAVIPTTLHETTLGAKTDGDLLNVEVDIIARYIRRFLEHDDAKGGLSMQKLIEEGFA